jgi:hypothetical protein
MTCGRSVVFSCTPVSSTNKTDRHDLTEIMLKVALNIINQAKLISSIASGINYYYITVLYTFTFCSICLASLTLQFSVVLIVEYLYIFVVFTTFDVAEG